MVVEAEKLINEIEELGGMTKAVEAGVPKLRIEAAAAEKQARIDRGEEIIVGVNKFQVDEEEELAILEIDNDAVRDQQIAKLKTIKAKRDQAAVDATLEALTKAAKNESGNLLELAVEAMRVRATVGEVSAALETSFGRHNAEIRSISGVYGSAFKEDEGFLEIQNRIQAFESRIGRRPRMLVVKMGQDGHDRGAKIIGTAFADLGFDVDIGPLFQTPAEAAKQAIENDVHVIGVSTQAAGHKTLIPSLVESLTESKAQDILVICGGVIPTQDYDALKAAGVAAIFGPGTNIPEAAMEVVELIEKHATI